MVPSLEAVAPREPMQQPDLRVAELEAQLRQLEQELAAAREKLAAASQEIRETSIKWPS